MGDGHYISIINEPFVTNRIMGVSSFDYNDFTPLALLFDEYVIFAVKPDSPIKSGKDMLTRLRAGADSVTFAFGSSRGNNTHLAIGLVGKLANAQVQKMKMIVFGSGGVATAALLGGHVDVLVTTPAPIREQLKARLVRGIAMTSPKRLGSEFADIPTWREQGVDAVFSSWRMAFGPKGMSREQIAFWVDVFAKVSATEEWKSDLDSNARERHFLTGSDLHKFLDAQRTQLEIILTEIGMVKH
jgi:putative tricarboxylic transport membrane protein